MPSGKRSKQQRSAAPPPVQSKGSARARQASPRMLAIGAGVLALIVVAIVLGVVLTGGKDAKVPTGVPNIGSPTSDVALPGATDVDAEFKGVPQNRLVLGSGVAPVTLVEYIDLQCPFCQQFETQVMPDIVTEYVKTGKVKVETRILGFIGPDSVRGRKAAVAAGLQNMAYPFMALLYYNQGTENTGWLTDDMIAAIAASVRGMNVPKLLNDAGSSSVSSQVAEFEKQQLADKVSSTPTLYVGKSGQKPKVVAMSSATDKQALVDAIENALP